MTSVHGNKTLAATLAAGLSLGLMLFGSLLSQKRAKIRLYEKKYAAVEKELEEKNAEEKEAAAMPVKAGQNEND